MRSILFLLLICCTLITMIANGQNNLTVSMPMIYGRVSVKDNWFPPTAFNRQDKFNGTSLGYGLNVQYLFKAPAFLIKNQHFRINIGAGYFQQRFTIERPLDYQSPLFIIFYTKSYSYDCIHGLLGLSYNSSARKGYSIIGSVTYNLLNSFRQKYTVTYAGSPSQINHKKIDFGDMLNLAIGINKNLGKNFSIGLCVLVPMYTRWRNDKIFKDDPSTFSQPSFSLGSSVSVAYHFVK